MVTHTSFRFFSKALLLMVMGLFMSLAMAQAPKPSDQQKLAQIKSLAAVMEADRQLLVELRKDFPDDRAEAEAYLERIRDFSLKSDPVRLGPVVAKMMQIAPAYLKWRDTDFPTSEEAAKAYVQSGAREFRTAFTNLTNAILQTVVNHLDTLLNQLGN